MKYRIFVGVVGQAENMQVEPVLETQPTMENNIDDSMQIIFHKNNKETRDKGKEYIIFVHISAAIKGERTNELHHRRDWGDTREYQELGQEQYLGGKPWDHS